MSFHINGLARLAAVILVPGIVYAIRAGTSDVTQTLEVSPGDKIQLLSQTPTVNAQGESSLLVSYQTAISFDADGTGIKKEAARVCQQFSDPARSYSHLVLNANESPQGILITSSRTRTFIFDREASGQWTAEADIK